MKSKSIAILWLWFIQSHLGDRIQPTDSVSATLPWTISAFSYFRSCPLSATIQYAAFNSTTHQYEIIPNIHQPPPQRRNLHSSHTFLRRIQPDAITTPRHVSDIASNLYLPVRECTCPTPYRTYCPMISVEPTDVVFNACAQSRDGTTQSIATCFVSPRLDLYLFARSTWPLIVFLLCTIVIFLAFTQTGKSVRKCITRQLIAVRWRRRRRQDASSSALPTNTTFPMPTSRFQRIFGSNEAEVHRIVEQELHVRHQMLESSYIAGIRMWLRIHGLEDEQDVTAFIEHYRRTRDVGFISRPDPSSRLAYVLKTKHYVSPTKSSPQSKRILDRDDPEDSILNGNVDELNKECDCNDRIYPENLLEDDVCAICYNVIEDGDKVGALTCNHNFHVECLTAWIQRRNVCPLCLAPNIAKRTIDRTPEVTNNRQHNDSSNNHESNVSPSIASDHVMEVPVLNEISQRRESSAARERGNSPQRYETSSPRASPTRVVRGIVAHRNHNAN